MTVYIVTAPYVTAETAVSGSSRARVDIPRGAALPAEVPPADRDALLTLGHIQAQAEVVVPADPEPDDPEPGDPDAVPDGTAAAVLEWVAGDQGRAARALAVEQAKGDGARKGLAANLSKLVEA